MKYSFVHREALFFLDGKESLDESYDEIDDDSEKSGGEESDISPKMYSAHHVDRVLTKLQQFDQGHILVPTNLDHLQDARCEKSAEESGEMRRDSEGSGNNSVSNGIQSEVTENGPDDSGNKKEKIGNASKEFDQSTDLFGIKYAGARMPAEASDNGSGTEYDDYGNNTEDTEIRSESERSSDESFSEINTNGNGDDDLLRQLGKKLYIFDTNNK